MATGHLLIQGEHRCPRVRTKRTSFHLKRDACKSQIIAFTRSRGSRSLVSQKKGHLRTRKRARCDVHFLLSSRLSSNLIVILDSRILIHSTLSNRASLLCCRKLSAGPLNDGRQPLPTYSTGISFVKATSISSTLRHFNNL